ncbi:MAG TPA: alpha/beta hydrolase [Bryobacteraceae bacterium]|jgi:acetyl esterase/lipase|nr:alpha/beta hydrolase [Bryobacteraceae bacterium]
MSKGIAPFVAALLPVLFAVPCRSEQPAGVALSPVQENVSYGHGLLLDVYPPTAASANPRPAVVLIHGGGWSSLDKSTMRTMAQFLARHGFVAFAVNYRLFQNGENHWPAQLDDVQRAVRWVRAHSAQYGVNPQRIGAFGHSAGAQLAALLGLEDTRDNSDPELAKYSSKVQAVVDVSGPTDFTRDHDSDGNAFLAEFLGVAYAKHPEVWRNASPVFQVSKDDAPFLILHGTQDDEVPIAQSQELLAKLQSAGVPASLIKVDDVHTFQTPEARRELALQTLAFFDRYLNAAQ